MLHMLTGNSAVHTPRETLSLTAYSPAAGSHTSLRSTLSILNAGKGPLMSRESQSSRKTVQRGTKTLVTRSVSIK